MVTKETVRRPKGLPEQPPKSPTAYLTARTLEPIDRSLAVLFVRLADRFVDSDPFSHGCDFAKRHAGLCHPPGPWVHPQKQNLDIATNTLQIGLVRLPSIVQGIVGVRDGIGKRQQVDRIGEV